MFKKYKEHKALDNMHKAMLMQMESEEEYIKLITPLADEGNKDAKDSIKRHKVALDTLKYMEQLYVGFKIIH